MNLVFFASLEKQGYQVAHALEVKINLPSFWRNGLKTTTLKTMENIISSASLKHSEPSMVDERMRQRLSITWSGAPIIAISQSLL